MTFELKTESGPPVSGWTAGLQSMLRGGSKTPRAEFGNQGKATVPKVAPGPFRPFMSDVRSAYRPTVLLPVLTRNSYDHTEIRFIVGDARILGKMLYEGKSMISEISISDSVYEYSLQTYARDEFSFS